MKKKISALLAILMTLGCLSCFASCGEAKDPNSITPTNLSFKDSAEAYKNGQIDAFFCTAGEPTNAVSDLDTTNAFSLVAIEDSFADALIAKYPFYTKHIIKAGTYAKNVTADVQTVAVKATLITANSMSADQVYTITKALFETSFSHAKADFIDVGYALTGLGGVPVHEGAARYYAEKLGISVDELCTKYGITVANATGTDAASTIRFTTGGDSGTYYGFGGILATGINGATGLNIVPQTSGGSKANVFALEDGQAEIGWVQNDVMYYAYTGTDLFKADEKCSKFSVIAAVYPETCQIIATGDVKTVADLKGKTVSIGDAGSGVEFNARQILDAYGITVK